MFSVRRWVGGAVTLTIIAFLASAEVRADDGIEFFEKQIRPVLVQRCYECHSGAKIKGGLRLDTKAGWTAGGDSGPAIVPGKIEESPLILALRYTPGEVQMPPKGKLPEAVIKDFEKWVTLGAPDPRTQDAPLTRGSIDIEQGKKHWAYQLPNAHAAPPVQDLTWPLGPIDRFILAKLENEGLTPNSEAGKITLIRRVYFDLVGLPPTPSEIDDFIQDARPDAWERLVERLLASPEYGRRWGRHWLDVARFAESMTLRGFIFKEAWRYRDYVIDAFNADRPFDQMVREQVAGDLLLGELTGEDPEILAEKQWRFIATAFLVLGNTNLEEQDKQQLEMDVVDEQLDVISKGFLAQTLTCARCHDHKFDPIPQRDYYALAGILKNAQTLEHSNVSAWLDLPLPLEPEREAAYARQAGMLADLKKQIAAVTAELKPSSKAGRLLVKDVPGIVVDDTQAKQVGTWKKSQVHTTFIGDGYIHDDNASKGEKTLTFDPELPRDGKYEVRLAYAPGSNRATNCQVTVFSADGEKTHTIDMQKPPPLEGRFVSLGQYQFEKSGQSFVIINNAGTNGHVCPDAVQFLPADQPATKDPAPSSKSEGDDEKVKAAQAQLKDLEAELKKQTASLPPRPKSMSVAERAKIGDSYIHIRGSVHGKGDAVPRGLLQVALTGTAPEMPKTHSGRKELAEWLASRNNPLTARVIVNRTWQWLFGVGLVRTSDNFGTTGETPSHPELLDDLAVRFMDQGWSMKRLIREIVLSRTYRLSSEVNPQSAAKDPENRWLSRANRRRLDAECLRDAILAASGQLRLEHGGPTFPAELAADYGFVHTQLRRSIYVPVFRNTLPELFDVFDFADPSVVTGKRNVSTVATQALFLMNHPFVLEQSKHAANQWLADSAAQDPERVRWAYRQILGRAPTSAEEAIAVEFVAKSENRAEAWAMLGQALFASLEFRYVK